MIFDKTFLVAYGLLALRIIIAIIFFSSGQSHLANPVERGKSIGMPPSFTKVLGVVEIFGAFSIGLGVFTQIGALLLMGVMAGALQKKLFFWKTKFYEENGYGWHYDLLLLCGLFVIFSTNGGYLTLF